MVGVAVAAAFAGAAGMHILRCAVLVSFAEAAYATAGPSLFPQDTHDLCKVLSDQA